MSYSKDHFTLSTKLTKAEVEEKISNGTLRRSSLLVEKTDKLFIGQINNQGFRIIGATPIASLCVARGVFKDANDITEIQVETSLHKPFLILFTCWFVVLTMVIVGFAIKNSEIISYISRFLILMFAATIFRLLLHLGYVRSRDNTISMIESIVA
ncbi:hypothetical protein [Mucilaginibacter agri]|uniref:Uncharacterized protein n=1 Tax=Mucilaginibacter agri TaxID=2695265 RepID=A0A965ZIN2_9SPHI|nr:hypothetical protein [Mucilaginibacter agri]NCD70679.1 hypothetical protein [Mucilaginibacter agri]